MSYNYKNNLLKKLIMISVSLGYFKDSLNILKLKN
jgi:hypothetical protein